MTAENCPITIPTVLSSKYYSNYGVEMTVLSIRSTCLFLINIICYICDRNKHGHKSWCVV